MEDFDFTKYPNITTERLLLRRITLNDAPAYLELRSDLRVMQYIHKPRAKTLEDAKGVIQKVLDVVGSNEGVHWGITVKGQPDKVVGAIGYYRMNKPAFRAEIGYMLHPDLHGQGLMSEALRAALAYGFNEMNLHSVNAYVKPANLASCGILEKHHFKKEAHFREDDFFEGKFWDTVVYGLLRSEWEEHLQNPTSL